MRDDGDTDGLVVVMPGVERVKDVSRRMTGGDSLLLLFEVKGNGSI